MGLLGVVMAPVTALTLKEPRRAMQAKALETSESAFEALRELMRRPAYR